MPRETSYLPINNWRGAAGYIAVMAYPENIDKRDKLITAIGNWIDWNSDKKPHGNAKDDVPKAIAQTLDAAGRRLKKRRAAAGHIAVMNMFGIPIAELIERYSTGLMGDESFMRKEVWRQSKPVLHLLMAFQNTAPSSDFLNLVTHPEWVAPALCNAEQLREFLTWSGKYSAHKCPLPRSLRIKDERVIQLLPC